MGEAGTAAATGVGVGAGLAMAQRTGAEFGAAVPPPLPGGGRHFHVAVDGQPQGPFDPAALAERATAGGLTAETLVWAPGMAGWTRAGEVDELRALLADRPPPLPSG